MTTTHKLIQLLVIATCLFIVGVTGVQAEAHAGNKANENPSSYANPSSQNWGQMSNAMKKSMDPNVMNNMMAMMMNPEKMMSMESCAQCHDGEDVARYQKDFGPMMDAMKPMAAMMNPMMNMMSPMMAPMMGMMGPTMGMMGPMMNPMMSMMGPMINPMMGMGGSMMSPTMGMVNPMMNPAGMMDPKQYEQLFNQWNNSMGNMTPQTTK